MKKLSCLLFILFLTSCTANADHAVLAPGCKTPGSLQPATIEQPTRGYTYNYIIYLPPCYDAATVPGYPVIYLIPGNGGSINDWVQAGINEIADQLILAQQVPPFILVATENTTNDPYAADIYTDLIPRIDKERNTLPNRQHRAVAGGSLGGIAAYRLILQYPDDFASAGLFGSGVINGENEQVKTWLAATHEANRPRFFVNVGEQDPLMLAQAQEIKKIFDESQITYTFIVGEGDHSYNYWATNIGTYFRWAAQDW